MSNSLFSTKGVFQPLSSDVLARFNAEQRAAYDELAQEVAALVAANAEAESAIVANRATLNDLREAEIAEAKKPKTSFLNEWRAAKEQYRKDHP